MNQSINHRIRWTKKTKKEAREMRLSGESFPEIIRKLSVPKSTLHSWLRDLGRPEQFSGENRKLWWKEMQKLAVEANRKKYSEIYSKIAQKAQSEVEEVIPSQNLYKPLLSVLSWAEGAKTQHNLLAFANTDPKLILLYLTLLRKCYPIDESKLRVRVHLHDYHNEEKVKKFWSELLDIPLTQFGKTYRKERSKEKSFRRNFGGICFVVYNSVYLRAEIVQYALSLGEKITGAVNIPEISTHWENTSS